MREAVGLAERVSSTDANVLITGESGVGKDLLASFIHSKSRRARAEHPRDPWSGHMALPGGRADAGDADLVATAMRETEEEVGLALARGDLLGELDEVGPHAGSAMRLTVRAFVFAPAGRTGLRPSEEVAEALWVEVDALRGGACEAELLVRGELRRVDAYRVEQRLVWGMTQRILASLLALA